MHTSISVLDNSLTPKNNYSTADDRVRPKTTSMFRKSTLQAPQNSKDHQIEYLEYLAEKAQKFRDRLLGVILGFKTRRVLKRHKFVAQYRADYQDLLAFAFKLQVELSQLNE